MADMLSSQARHSYLLVILPALCCLVIGASIFSGYWLDSQHRYMQRGVLSEALPAVQAYSDRLYGVNASLEQYASEDDLQRVLRLAKEGGFHWIRQHFPWAEIEPSPGEYHWERWDRIVAEVGRLGLELIAVLDASPVWARSPIDRDNRFAPPQFVTTYGLFVRAFAQRYGEQITYYEIWDQPNISPHWGARPIDPAEYVRLLKVAAKELKQWDANAIVLCAGLAPNVESGGRNMSEVLFLRGIYQAGGKGYFDVLAAKPYGFWSGPEDRRVSPQVLNFSRLILLREEMVRHGDSAVPIWAVEFGWNALPRDWEGQPSPWGTDEVATQTRRTSEAIQRARKEWGWLGVMCWAQLQPAAPLDDPLWGFALLDPDFTPTPFYSTLHQAIYAPVSRIGTDNIAYSFKLLLVATMALLACVVLVRVWPASPWRAWLCYGLAIYQSAPQWLQWALPGLLLAVYYFLPWSIPSLLALALSGVLISLRLDIGLTYLVFSIPFFLRPKAILGKSFSVVETLTLLCFVVWLLSQWFQGLGNTVRSHLLHLKHRLRNWLHSLNAMDWAVIAFFCVAALSLLVSTYRGVSIREFRVVIVEPVLLYFLLRQVPLDEKQHLHLVDALLMAGVAMSFLGLYQYFISGDVIVAEGVRRVRGIYASPNNLSLLLGRIIPFALSFPIVGRGWRRRWYGISFLPLAFCLFLTYSRGGWLLSFPAAALTVGLLRGRRATLFALVVIALCLLMLLPLVGTERVVSLFNLEQGTTFRRIKLWEATWAMIRDYPITGVGLDNFLYRYPEYMLPEAWQEPDLSHPHNIVLDYWTRLGIGGVVVLIWLEGAFFRTALRLYRDLPDGNERAIILGLIASMVAMLAHGLIDNSYFLVDLAFLFFLGFGLIRAMEARYASAN
ncbi:MAG: O-antigen ligase family protein [Chloroflexi bacterium]|nr:O-antigen ligase family protein [Chloroflexota bacterium]